MTGVFGWVSHDPREAAPEVIARMGATLRVQAAQAVFTWRLPGLSLGLFDLAPLDAERAHDPRPATDATGRHWLWMAGEVIAARSDPACSSPEGSRTIAFRRMLLDALLARGAEAVRDLDGEYQIAWWDGAARVLTLLNDRFGALPLYVGSAAEGIAFACGVRGVLAAPGMACAPDPDAIREAVTFGGFRLGGRTNVRGVTMVPGAAAVRVAAGAPPATRRYWRWREIPAVAPRDIDAVIDGLEERWTEAIRLRLAGSGRPGLMLSGGLDSRAILAEATRQRGRVRALTYGVPACDDVRFARRAASACGAEWQQYPLFSGDWLDRRTAAIQHVDGLMDLVDLMHVEALDTACGLFDLYLSGYIGDAVSGPTFNDVLDAERVALALPYFGGRLGWAFPDAVARARDLVADLAGAPPRFALFDHKLPQSTNRITAAARPFVRVRRPFVDYRFFELAQGVPDSMRGAGALHARWLRRSYPGCFARIPVQKTGAPVLTPRWRSGLIRAERKAVRTIATGLRRAGLPVTAHVRGFHPDWEHWRVGPVRRQIEETILRSDSLSCGIFGAVEVQRTLEEWFDRQACPTQVIGALYAFEVYHRDLPGHLRRAEGDAGTRGTCAS